MTAAPSLLLSDAEIARRVQSGSESAEAELCRRFGPRVRAFGLRHLRDVDKADELSQRVLILVIEKLRGGDVRDEESIASFVLGSARFVAQAMKRADARLRPLDELEEPWHEPSPLPSLDARRVAVCLKELAERDRTVIALSFFDEMNAAEIASVVGITPGNVRVMRHRALSALRECFERQERAS
jgi:RNA polymerase sigma-70 factor (ECF subfamily)